MTSSQLKLALTPVAVLGSFATALSPFLGPDQRNYLVILVSFVVVTVTTFSNIPRRMVPDLAWIAALIAYQLLVTIVTNQDAHLSTVMYTALLSLTYFGFSTTLNRGWMSREQALAILKGIVYAYCFLSVAQAAASIAGLPIPNQILSKGMWSYNSLAVEPSHAVRALALTMIAILAISRPQGLTGLWELLKENGGLLVAFLLASALTGSALAFFAAPLAIALSLRTKWLLGALALTITGWPLLLALDLPAAQRMFAFLAALPSMDIAALAAADQSGAMRVMPLLIYLQKFEPWSAHFFFGEGIEAVARYVGGELVGAGDLVAAGFVPGFLISFGLAGVGLLLHTFVFRFLNWRTLPLAALWLALFATSAWNGQLFWYGLMLLRTVHYFVANKAAPARKLALLRGTS